MRILLFVFAAPTLVTSDFMVNMDQYPGVSNGVRGKLNIKVDGALEDYKSLQISGNLAGLEMSKMGVIHIHSGTSCETDADVQGHWYDGSDYWNTIGEFNFTANTLGEATIDVSVTAAQIGFPSFASSGGNSPFSHAVVVHDSNDIRVGCGVIQKPFCMNVGECEFCVDCFEADLYGGRASNDQLTVDLFYRMTTLGTLNLHGSGFAFLPSGLFDRQTALLSLGLDQNVFVSLPVGIFDSLTNLEILRLETNNLAMLNPGVFDKTVSLKRLYLENNKLTNIPTGIFSTLTKLETLHLENNLLVALPANAFSIASLKTLYLEGNVLVDIPWTLFSSNNALETINFKNVAAGFPRGVFDVLTSTTALYLDESRMCNTKGVPILPNCVPVGANGAVRLCQPGQVPASLIEQDIKTPCLAQSVNFGVRYACGFGFSGTVRSKVATPFWDASSCVKNTGSPSRAPAFAPTVKKTNPPTMNGTTEAPNATRSGAAQTSSAFVCVIVTLGFAIHTLV